VGIASAVTGDGAGFLFGRTGGQRLFEQLAQKFHYVRRHYDRLQIILRAHGNKVFLARFVAGARFMAGPMAGATEMPFRHFLGWNLLGACVWCPSVITVGYFSAMSWVAWVAHWASYAIAGAVLLVLAMMWFCGGANALFRSPMNVGKDISF
jgi:membrane protein DedA with SNARE-associated domain